MPNLLNRRSLVFAFAVVTLALVGFRAMSEDPEKVGRDVFDIYVDTMAKANALLEDRPQSVEVADEIEQIKENAIKKLVVTGRRIAGMHESDRAIVEATVRQLLSEMRNAPQTKKVYNDYQEIWQAYHGGNSVLFDNIKSLNILTQYAFFDLLRAQAPAEADRLGV